MTVKVSCELTRLRLIWLNVRCDGIIVRWQQVDCESSEDSEARNQSDHSPVSRGRTSPYYPNEVGSDGRKSNAAATCRFERIRQGHEFRRPNARNAPGEKVPENSRRFCGVGWGELDALGECEPVSSNVDGRS